MTRWTVMPEKIPTGQRMAQMKMGMTHHWKKATTMMTRMALTQRETALKAMSQKTRTPWMTIAMKAFLIEKVQKRQKKTARQAPVLQQCSGWRSGPSAWQMPSPTGKRVTHRSPGRLFSFVDSPSTRQKTSCSPPCANSASSPPADWS